MTIDVTKEMFLRLLKGIAFAGLTVLPAGCSQYGAGGGIQTPPGAADCAAGPVSTRSGPACGTRVTAAGRTVEAFLGMPYASASRWQDPQLYGSWNGTFHATNFGPICPQQTAATNPQNEDCLSINVWRPQGASNLPVMVFIYGGGFVEGASAFPMLNGAQMAASQNAVVVSFNYRLGALGFLAGSFADGGTLQGNFGFKDQQKALEWVGLNIGGFGGNTANTTLFGESAGAMSVGLHMLSAPASRGRFQKAIMESNPFALPYKSLTEAGAFGTKLQKALGCQDTGLACMKLVSPQAIVDKQLSEAVVGPAFGKGFVDFLIWAPVIDSSTITGDPIKGAIDRPTILGTNLDEANVFVGGIKQKLQLAKISKDLYELILLGYFGVENVREIVKHYSVPPSGDATQSLESVLGDYLFTCANRWMASHAQNTSRLWGYQFRPKTTYDIWKGMFPDCVQKPQGQSPICHGDELPYVFDSWSALGVTPSNDEKVLTQTIMGYWGSLAASGAPSGAVAWSPFSENENYLLLLNPPVGQIHPFPSCSFWDRIGYDLKAMPHTLFESH